MATLEQQAAIYRNKQKKHRVWQRILTAMAAIVVFFTTYALILPAVTRESEPTCGQTEHQHTDDCYAAGVLLCEEEEHTHHEILCYVDPDATMETAEEWETTLPDALYGDWIEDVIEVANTQLGYTESEDVVTVDGDGQIRGATRYGVRYGDPFGEWDALFVSFCLYYAEVDAAFFPQETSAYRFHMALVKQQLYAAVGEDYTPKRGDLVFFEKTGDGNADRVGVLVATDAENGTFTLIEGNTAAGAVETVTYAANDSKIMGYGKLNAAYQNYLDSLTLGDTLAEMPEDAFAKTTAYDKTLFTDTNRFVVYTTSGSNHYAFDGNGNAVQIFIDQNGYITTNLADTDLLLWSFTSDGNDTYTIQNVGSKRYMRAYTTNGGGVTSGSTYSCTLIASEDGIKLRNNTEYATLNEEEGVYEVTSSAAEAAVYQLAMTSRCIVWLDGTNGGLMSLEGSPDTMFSLEGADTSFTLPETWESPAKYDYTLRGWYDLKNSRYYLPGTKLTVTDNLVFYADWMVTDNDVGLFNTQVADTVSTNKFITTHVFDYSHLFNVQSESVDVTISDSDHSEVWSLIANGKVPYQNADTINFIFRDWDKGSRDISYPKNNNSNNNNGDVFPNLYNEKLGELLFDPDNSYDPLTGTGVIGKEHLGMADHLFQYMSNPNDEHYGYYYYDSALNAASYNQSESRFYVYDYLERTSDSANASGEGKYSDFLPLNSPYANTNGQTVKTYSYDGEDGEYPGVVHYSYDAKYNGSGSETGNVGTNFGFGMSIDVNFFLPETPGTKDADGNYGNKDVYGKDMHFQFSGDDDVWVLVDGKLVLDIGGIHGIKSGDINFSTGEVVVDGEKVASLSGLSGGAHVLTMYYLERGSSQSNCAIYFNLAPRFDLTLQKEDVLTRELLDGAEFSVYTDKACTVPAELWFSREDYENDAPSISTFAVKKGIAQIWGFAAGRTYYIKETKPPDNSPFGCAHGLISLSLDKKGDAKYHVEILPDSDDSDVSDGFSVHGFRVDEEEQQAYIVITNAYSNVKGNTQVHVSKKWDDNKDHSADAVTVYLKVQDPDGKWRRLREATLNAGNGWQYTFTGLPKYRADDLSDIENLTEIVYTVEEAYTAGYQATVAEKETLVTTTSVWDTAKAIQNGETYILKTSSGCLSTKTAEGETFMWVTEDVAKHSSLAQWTATVSGSNITFTNGEGKKLTYNYSSRTSGRYFYATDKSATYQTVRTSGTIANGFKLYATRNSSSYYMGALNSSGQGSSTNQSGALTFAALVLTETTVEEKVDYPVYEITNTPLDKETSLTVNKVWDVDNESSKLYEQAQVPIRLYANGVDTGRIVTLNAKNNWVSTFEGLPYEDKNGDVIVYSVVEEWNSDDWETIYGTLNYFAGDPGQYSITVTNRYQWGYVYELPATGGVGAHRYIWCGIAVLLSLCIAVVLYRIKQKVRGAPSG